MELKFIQSMMAIRVPMEPKNLLNGAKWLTKYENIREVTMERMVAKIDPGVNNLSFDLRDGAR
jgi:hypothetical protein